MGKRILMVEDRSDDRYLMRWLLDGMDLEVRDAADGDAALAACAEWSPDLVLLDFGLPDMDGLELMKRLRAAPGASGLPIIAVTARVLPEEREMALSSGCTAYVPKPVVPESFVAIVRSLIGSS